MFNKKLTVASRLAFGFGALLLLMVVVALIGVSRLQDVEEITNTLTDKDRLVAYAITDIEALVRSNGLAVLELTIVKDVARMEHLRKEITRNRSKISDALSTVESVDGEVSHRPLLADIVRARVTAADSIDKVLKLIEDGRREDAIATVTSETIPFLTATQAAIATLSASESKIIISRAADVKRITNAAYAMIFTVNGIAIGIAILIALSISRKLTGQLGGEPEYVACVAKAVAAGDLTMVVETKDGDKSSLLFSMKEMCFRLSCNILRVQTGTDTIASATNQIAAGNLDLSARTEQQASALEETASSMEQLSSTVKQNADNAKQANTLAISASDVASRGGKVVSEVVDTMGAINDSAKKIVDIIDVIDGIAFQTNILALNAAVEAARAGEQGKGFAVVATEVRSLAQRSASAAKEIKFLIDSSVEKIEIGSTLVDQAGATMEEIVASVRRVTDIMSEITTASMEQEAGIQQINQAITEMDDVTQQNASLVEQAADASAALQEQASVLMDVVHVFKVDRTSTRRGLEGIKNVAVEVDVHGRDVPVKMVRLR